MSTFRLFFLLRVILVFFSLQAHAAFPSFMAEGPLPSLAPILDKVTPAVVNIATKNFVQQRENPLLQDPFFRRFFQIPNTPTKRSSQSLGSGVIVDAQKGLIITNHHVIGKADEITVTLRDGRSFNATVVGSDPESDVAVIKIKAEGLTKLKIADSDNLRVGDFVVAIGNPFGLGQTVTSGIVSALGRSGLGIEGYEDFIQTDASINPGNSGGALINLRGELIGINTAIIAPNGGNVGIGFAIPSNMAISLKDQLVKFGKTNRGQLGISVQDLTPDL
ncbi:MAG: trypsin-like peptidase domain-containing protein, partial [Cycloclasticus sp.]|nr:trypsin-like peptidase domain-containing protein [Cycloclasticus sp.]